VSQYNLEFLSAYHSE